MKKSGKTKSKRKVKPAHKKARDAKLASGVPKITVSHGLSNADTDLVLTFQDSTKKAISGNTSYAAELEKFKKNTSFSGAAKSLQFLRFAGRDGAENVLFAGMGLVSETNDEKARHLGGLAYQKLQAEKSKTISIQVDGFLKTPDLASESIALQLLHAFLEGVILRAYSFDKYKSKSDKTGEPAGPLHFVLVTLNKTLAAQLNPIVSELAHTAASVNVTRDWSNEPSNFGTPEYFAREAQRLAKTHGLKCTILSEKDAAREKMGLFLGVGAGSEREGKIVVLEYNPKGVKKPKTIAWVGKGVTFDSGGISIKPSLRMEEMKHDMTGAATLMGATLLAASLKVPNRIVTILAFTENMPDGKAIQPGNVLTARNGKTVEIINTDAEGRLILADVLDYAHEFNPDVIINAATLTGAVGVALGKQCCGLFGNDPSLVESLQKAGLSKNERLWQLPLYDEYFEDLKSETADMRNSANDSSGGCIRGAIFLKQFIRKGFKWAHLDIASTCWDLGHLPYYPKRGAAGSFVRTLAKFAADF